MKEIWKDIKGYEGLYQVSNVGRVKSLERVVVGKDGKKYPVPERVLKQCLHKKTGYYSVKLSKKGEKKTKDVHVLVAVAFLSHVPKGNAIVPHHVDRDKTNNNVKNLKLVTNRKNTSEWQTDTQTGETNIRRTPAGKFKVSFRFGPNNRKVHIGTYETIEDAIIVRDKKLAEIEAGTFVPRLVRPPAEKQSKYCCVTWDKDKKKWRVRLKGKHLGRFEDDEEAHRVVEEYKKALL